MGFGDWLGLASAYIAGFVVFSHVMSGNLVQFILDFKRNPSYPVLGLLWFIVVPAQLLLVLFEYIYGWFTSCPKDCDH